MRTAPIVIIALAVSIATSLGMTIEGMIDVGRAPAFGLAVSASSYAVGAALVVGYLELASRLRGSAAVGMKLAAGAVVCGRAVDLARWVAVTASPRFIMHHATLSLVASGICSLSMIAGLTIAAWPRTNRAIAGCVAAVISLALGVFAIPLVFAVVDSRSGLRVAQAVGHLPWICEALAVMWLVAQITPAEAVPDPRLAARGVRWMSRALWGRVFAVIAFVFVTISMTGNQRTLQSLYVGELALTLVLFGAFGIGALAVVKAATGVRRVPFVLAGLGMFWCGAMTLARVPMIYEMFTGRGGLEGFVDSHVGVFAVAEPLVMLLSIGVVASGLRSIGAVRTAADASTSVAFAAVMVAAIAVQEWGLQAADSQSAVIGVMLLASILVIIAMGLMAMVLGGVAARLESNVPDLPTAKVV